MPGGFFCCAPNRKLAIAEPFTANNIALEVVTEHCEKVFGIKASELSKQGNESPFTLLQTIGFGLVYSIAKRKDDAVLLRVDYLDELNAFLMAETPADKRELYLLHARNYISKYLKKCNISEPMQQAFKPIMDFVAQRFHLASYDLLKGGLTKNRKSSEQKQYITNLTQLGKYVTGMLFVAMNIKEFLDNTTAKTEATLRNRLVTIDKWNVPQADLLALVKLLGYDRYLTKDEAIRETRAVIHQSRENGSASEMKMMS